MTASCTFWRCPPSRRTTKTGATLTPQGAPTRLIYTPYQPAEIDQALFTDVLYGFGGKLYFIRDESSSCGLYAIDLETDKQELIYDGNFEEAVFYDNKLYFIPWDNHNYGHAFYRLSLTGGEPELLFDIPQAATQSIALRCYHNWSAAPARLSGGSAWTARSRRWPAS